MNQNYHGNLAAPSHNWSSRNMGSLTSTLRETVDLSLKETSCPRNSLFVYISHPGYRRDDPFPLPQQLLRGEFPYFFIELALPQGVEELLMTQRNQTSALSQRLCLLISHSWCFSHIPKLAEFLSTADCESHLSHHVSNYLLPLGWLSYLGSIPSCKC